VLGAPQEEAIDAAAEAGFDALGLRFDAPPGDRRLADLAARIAAAGLSVLDVEVARLRPDTPAADLAWLVDAAGALDARFLLTVSECEDREWTRRELAALCEAAAPLGVTIGLEHMLFTAVRRLADAHALVEATGRENAAVLVDLLHLSRAGGDVAELLGPEGRRVGYVQICDGPAVGPTTAEALRDEARHHRLLPGQGELPVAAFLAAAGTVPVSVEVQSDELAARCSAAERARAAGDAARFVLERGRPSRPETP
jgi:sugar phosphate isomerase/epimerase